MAKNIKGLTVEIGGDTTQLGKALENVNKKSKDLSSELGQVNRLLKMDPGNADLIAQKQQILAEAVENTSKKLDTLKEAEKQVQAQFERGEASAEQVRALKREIEATEQKLKGYKNAAKEVADGNDKIKKTAEEAAEANKKMGDYTAKALKGLGGLLSGAATGLAAATEASRDYRMEMGKLDTAFTDNGFSSQAATGAYKELVGILGEYDQSVEAANHLAKLTDNEKDLATWTGDILPGVFATFGDSLPIEGLTEAANETAKVGQVTGPLADALNWAGISEDAFNESLAKCTSEQERQKLITETLAKTYGTASEAYKETNADVIAANAANESWRESMAELGAAVEPVITNVKEMGAALVSDLVPMVQTLLNNLPAIAVALGGITAAMVAFKVAQIAATAATKGMTLAQYAAAAAQGVLNAVMAANPIGLIILAITALVTAFMLLWKNCESFREFWINLWEKIKGAASAAVEWLKGLPEKIWGAIVSAIERVATWGSQIADSAKNAAKNLLTGVVSTLVALPGQIWDAIVGAVGKVTTWGTNLVQKAKTAASNMLSGVVSTLTALPSRVWSAIVGAVSNVGTWGSNMVSKAKTAAGNVVSTVYNGLKSLPSKVLGIGGDLVKGLWNGINDKVGWVLDKIKGFGSSVIKGIKKIFGVNSPSKETAWVGEMLDEGLAEGMLGNVRTPVRAMQTVAGGVLDAADNVNGLTIGRQLQTTFPDAGTGSEGLGAKLDRILAAIERGQIITLDGDKLVGGTAERMDKRLGQLRVLAARGAL